MRRSLGLVVLLLSVIGLAAQQPADSYDAVAEEALKEFDLIGKDLATVDKLATFNAARPKLEASAKKLAELKARAAKLPPATPDQKKQTEAKFKSRYDPALIRIRDEIVRIATKAEGAAEIVPQLNKILQAEPPKAAEEPKKDEPKGEAKKDEPKKE